MHVRTQDGDLVLDRNGVTFRPFALHGQQAAHTWQWPQVRHVTVEQVGRRPDAVSWAWGPLWGLVFRSKQVAVTVSLEDRDEVFLTKQRLPELRVQARRVMEDVDEARLTVV